MPEAYAELCKVRETLERHYTDMQDIEFTVQSNKLYMLQTRNGKRTAAASLKVAVDMAEEGLIDHPEAVKRVAPGSLDQLLHPTLDPKASRKVLTKGLPASPGAACGVVVFSAEEAEARANKGEAVILVRIETSPEDIAGMHAAKGILTTRGGMTSHAAVVARGMGRACVAGAGDLRVDYKAQTVSVRGVTIKAGDTVEFSSPLAGGDRKGENADVTVTVRETDGTRFYVLGKVRTPGSFTSSSNVPGTSPPCCSITPCAKPMMFAALFL